MNSLSQICKQIVTDSIDHDYLLECGSLYNVYRSEYGYNGVTPRACKDYLQGLPTVCTVPFWDNEILEILKQHGIDVPQELDNNQDKAYDLIEAYWLECGKQFWLMIR